MNNQHWRARGIAINIDRNPSVLDCLMLDSALPRAESVRLTKNLQTEKRDQQNTPQHQKSQN